MLKHLPKNALKTIENDLLYIKKRVIIESNLDRTNHNLLQQTVTQKKIK